MASSGLRLLIVDDSPMILKMVHDHFAPNGYTVHKAENGAKALECLERDRPDVIVADILMPVMDGWELYEEVKRRPEAADIPFMFLSNQTGLSPRLKGFEMGADDYLTKPFAVEELQARIERILRHREGAPASEAETAVGEDEEFLAGSTDHMSIPDLVQILALNRKDTLIEVRHGDQQGEIVFQDGSIADARLGATAGRKALFRMLAWAGARFRVLPLQQVVADPTIKGKTSDLLMDAMVALDEWNRWKDQLPQPDIRLEIQKDARAKLADRKVSPAEFDVLARAKKSETVAEILHGSEMPDAEVAAAVVQLIGMGVVRPGSAAVTES